MPVNEASEVFALTLIFVVHVVGGLMLVWGMLDSGAGPHWWRRRDDGPGDEPDDPVCGPPSTRTPLPLPGASPSRVRLRDERRLGDAHPRPPRRPLREPHRPQPEPPRPRRSPARRR